VTSYKAFAIGPVSITSPIVGSYALVTLIISTFVFGEILKLNQWIGLTFLFFGLVAATYEKSNSRNNSKGITLAFIALLFIGCGIAGFVYAIKEIGWVAAVLLGYLFPTLWSGAYLLITKNIRRPEFTLDVFLLTAFQLLGTVAVSIGVEQSISAIVVPVSSVSPILTSVMGLIFFREKLVRHKLVGVGLIAVSLVLISL
jgi:drug/metabolite transporter (DMT)-like permease